MFVVPQNPIVCYRCAKKNHRAVNCFQIKPALQHVQCYRCGKEGHKANHCNKLWQQSQRQKGDSGYLNKNLGVGRGTTIVEGMFSLLIQML
jgi:hypothetical protein